MTTLTRLTAAERHAQAEAVRNVPLDDEEANEAMRVIRHDEMLRLRKEYEHIRACYRLSVANYAASLTKPRTWKPARQPVQEQIHTVNGRTVVWTIYPKRISK